jgi:hypothetical protein
MATPTDPTATELAAIQANLNAVQGSLTTIASGVLALDTLIQTFQNSPGSLSPADQASLDAISTASAALATQAAAVNTAAPSGGVIPPGARHR